MLLKARSVDATHGPIVKKIILYALPLLISTLIQKLFNAVDIVVLGNMADGVAVAAVGATTAIVSLIVDSFIGLSSGTKIIFSRHFGAKNEEKIKETEDTSLILGVVLGFAVAVFSIIFAPWFLEITKCPEDCFDAAVLYIRVYCCSAPAIMIYNFGSSVLTASGDTQRPLYYIIAGGVLNAVMNIILCLLLTEKVLAVAIATASSQLLCAVLVVFRLCKMEGLGKLVIKNIRFSWQSLGKILRFGLPLALNHALYPIANLQIQTAINDYGVSAVAGSSAASTYDAILSAFASPFGTTCSTFMGQNFGAGNEKRAKKSFWNCLWLALVVGAVGGIGFFMLAKPVLLPLVLGSDAAAVEFGHCKMFFVAAFYWMPALNSVFSNSINAYGYSIITSLSSIVCIFGFRMFWMREIYNPWHHMQLENMEGFKWLMACFTVSWAILLIFNIVFQMIAGQIAKKKGLKQI